MDRATVHVVMAIYKPEADRLDRQIESILAQIDVAPRLYLCADGPMTELKHVYLKWGSNANIQIVAFSENRGPADTFLDGLAIALACCEDEDAHAFLAFADQDDLWDDDKLASSVAQLMQCGTSAVHSDARLVDSAGRLLAASMFDSEQRKRTCTAESLFFRNIATGMTMLFDIGTARMALELRQVRPSLWLHDHFLAMIAMARDGLAMVDRPLVSYVQHGKNVVGAYRVRSPASMIAGLVRHVLKGEVWSREYLLQGTRFVAALHAAANGRTRGSTVIGELDRTLQERGLAATVRALGRVIRNGPADLVALQVLLDKLGDPRTRGASLATLC